MAGANPWPPYVPFQHPVNDQQAQADVNAVLAHNVGKPNAADKVGSAVTGAAKDAAGVVTGSAKFFEALANPDTWVRVGEVTFGIICLVVGIDYMTKAGVATKAVKASKAIGAV